MGKSKVNLRDKNKESILLNSVLFLVMGIVEVILSSFLYYFYNNPYSVYPSFFDPSGDGRLQIILEYLLSVIASTIFITYSIILKLIKPRISKVYIFRIISYLLIIFFIIVILHGIAFWNDPRLWIPAPEIPGNLELLY
jgi:hypothetical protein